MKVLFHAGNLFSSGNREEILQYQDFCSLVEKEKFCIRFNFVAFLVIF